MSISLQKLGREPRHPLSTREQTLQNMLPRAFLDLAIRATLKLLVSDSIENLLVYRRSKVYDLERMKR